MQQLLHVTTIGQGNPFILLAGWGWHSGIWQPLIPYLAERYQLFLIDLPGIGKSPLLSSDYTVENVAQALLDTAPANATWLGWSLGGMLAWYIAAMHPQRVSRLMTVASSPKFLSDNDWPGVAPATLEKFSQQLLQNHQKTLADFLELQLRGAPRKEELFTILQPHLTQANHTSLPALLGGLHLLQEMDLRPLLPKVQCPRLHILGSHDTLVPAAVASLIQPYGRTEIIKRSGHLPFFSQMDVFLQLIDSFMILNSAVEIY